MRTNKLWSQGAALLLCAALNAAKKFHPEDKEIGLRRDVDIMIYRSADEPEFNWQAFFEEIKRELRIEACVDYGYCKKARTAAGARIDFFDPFRGGEKVSDADE